MEDVSFQWPGANAQVRFVLRGSYHTAENFKVADLEKAKNKARTMAHEDIFCGVDKWCFDHFAYTMRPETNSNEFGGFEIN